MAEKCTGNEGYIGKWQADSKKKPAEVPPWLQAVSASPSVVEKPTTLRDDGGYMLRMLGIPPSEVKTPRPLKNTEITHW